MDFQEFILKVKELAGCGQIEEDILKIPLGLTYTVSFDGETAYVQFMNENAVMVEFGKEETKVVFSKGKGVEKELKWDVVRAMGLMFSVEDGFLVISDGSLFHH